ncbi:MAG: 1-acyl-sn-glycerol-3-phosphate acyltransferase [Spirulina sp. SIO3F2]|nr:1-acyl-sn-glycerol-3-phosphate acyltransferase [Spirulina sp. SIO3F2]
MSSRPEFYPSLQQPLFTRLVQSVSPLIGRGLFRVSLRVSLEDLAMLRSLWGERVVLMPNHPTFDDPIVLFMLGARAGELLHFLAADGTFKDFQGKIIQRLGAYSIRRGVGDRASIAHTLELLKKPQTRLVIFPEGGCSFQNDTVMPFRPGAVQMPFQAIARIAKRTGMVPNCHLIPVSLKYRYVQPMTGVIERTLRQLEQALGTVPQTGDFYPRLRQVGEAVLTKIEREYQTHDGRSDLNERIQNIRHLILTTCEQQLEIPPNESLPVRERVYKILFLLEAAEEPVPNHEAIYRDVLRLLNFDALYDGYVAEVPTPERFLDTLTRLEREVFDIDQPKAKSHRRAYLKLGQPINLADYWADYRRDRTATVEHITDTIHTAVQTNLTKLGEQTRSQVVPLP